MPYERKYYMSGDQSQLPIPSSQRDGAPMGNSLFHKRHISPSLKPSIFWRFVLLSVAGIDIVARAGDTIWSKIGRISPSGQITLFPLPDANCSPKGITTGPDGNLWFIEYRGGDKDIE